MPGDSAVIEVKANTGVHKGPFNKSIKVYSNDPKNPMVRLSISATVAEHEARKDSRAKRKETTGSK